MYLRAIYLEGDNYTSIYHVTEEGFFRISNDKYKKRDTSSWDQFILHTNEGYYRDWVWDVLTEDEAFVECI